MRGHEKDAHKGQEQRFMNAVGADGGGNSLSTKEVSKQKAAGSRRGSVPVCSWRGQSIADLASR